jgi:hypothetical protein
MISNSFSFRTPKPFLSRIDHETRYRPAKGAADHEIEAEKGQKWLQGLKIKAWEKTIDQV